MPTPLPTPPTLSLHYQYRPAAPDAEPPWLLVLLHGVGSNEHDLFGLAPHVPARFHVLSLRAPFSLGQGAFAWFAFGVGPDGERVIDEAQEAAARQQLRQAVADAAQQLGIPAARVVVGGFSQGGIMALALLLTVPGQLRAAMALHSRVPAQVLPQRAAQAQFAGKAAWVSHGTEDNVLPLANGHAIRDLLAPLPLALHYADYPGFHEIRPAELRDAMDWLDRLPDGAA